MDPDETRWMKAGLVAEIAELEAKILDRRTRLIALGGSGKAARPKGTRRPMSEESRQKIKAAQVKRWEARRRMEEEIAAARGPVKS